jgi:hypothetical protein
MNYTLACDRADTIILVHPVTYQVLKVGFNHCLSVEMADRARSRALVVHVLCETCPVSAFVVVERPADCLYTALAGHLYSIQHPRAARPDLARLARGIITRNRGVSEGWEIAARVVDAWGPVVQPWLGVVKLDERGGLVEACAEYVERLAL